ncbi:hypothetical protein WMY93_029159 [Mugilogobius chulae]|uniref:C1q domain-containing protein n=1 Tax=Mugilogobius chulae TaxID=88201 RepID=A0AAW0MTS6_9GOBI
MRTTSLLERFCENPCAWRPGHLKLYQILVAFCTGLYAGTEEGNYGPFNSLTTMVFKNILTNDGNGYNPATGTTCHRYDPVTGTTLPQVQPVTGTTLSQVRPCHRYDPVTGTTLSQVRPCHRYDLSQVRPVTGTTLSQVRLCHRYDPVTGTTLPQVRPVTGTTCHRYDSVTGTTLPQVRPVTGTTLPQVRPVTGTTLPQVRPVTGTTCHRYDSATGTTLSQVRLCHRYDPVTGVFQASVKGMYSFHVRLFSTYSPTPNLDASLKKNAQILGYMLDEASSDTHDSSSLSVVVPLEVGDSVFVELAARKSVYEYHGGFKNFCGFLIYPM